ncbi:MAG TPA: polysaccharide lyase 6 family protein, partial [Chitinophagaceae bacterium]|nr:polysaccharide lyase 6 family protein [Chitinophagaceae bacterium]
MIRLLLLNCFLLLNLLLTANTIIVKNLDELNAANKKARPGDIIILQNGEWKNITIKLNCIGTKKNPITFKSQAAGNVLITGNSKLKLGGDFIIIDGLYFTNGYAGDDAVISFQLDNKQLANNCRVTNTAIDDFNNPKRMDENNWVLFYGKNNRLDHCSFKNKKNMGVLLAVVLDDERSRENFHSIDHNYFGRRPPLASNGGEIIRVGVSQHCQFNSNTKIKNNFFEYCDGETEIISVKSCSNVVEENVFKECQGSVVLRHGDNNLVKGNYFLGNDKAASGGVRVINKGQKVINNIFYKCRGVDFRSPLAVMNGIINSPANRYVQVTNAEINSNVFYQCSPISFCEGSDAERTLPPDNVTFSNNIFYNTRDSIIYKVYDDIKGIKFSANKVSNKVSQDLSKGFNKISLPK